MKKILLLEVLLSIGICGRFLEINDRLFNRSNFKGSTPITIAMPPSPVKSPVSHYTFDYAMGTTDGGVFFASFDSYYPEYSINATQSTIKNLTWTNQGLHIVTDYEIKVIDPAVPNWNKLYMNFSIPIKTAVFSYSSSSNSILTAVSFSNRIEVFKNTQSIYNISMDFPCFGISFNSSGDNFYYFFYAPSSKYRLNRLHIPTLKVYEGYYIWVSAVNYGLDFVPVDGYRHLAVSLERNYFNQWINDAPNHAYISMNYNKFKFMSDGRYIVSYFNDFSPTDFMISELNLNREYFINKTDYQSINVFATISDLDTKRDKIIALTKEDKYLYTRLYFYSDSPKVEKSFPQQEAELRREEESISHVPQISELLKISKEKEIDLQFE